MVAFTTFFDGMKSIVTRSFYNDKRLQKLRKSYSCICTVTLHTFHDEKGSYNVQELLIFE